MSSLTLYKLSSRFLNEILVLVPKALDLLKVKINWKLFEDKDCRIDRERLPFRKLTGGRRSFSPSMGNLSATLYYHLHRIKTFKTALIALCLTLFMICHPRGKKSYDWDNTTPLAGCWWLGGSSSPEKLASKCHQKSYCDINDLSLLICFHLCELYLFKLSLC